MKEEIIELIYDILIDIQFGEDDRILKFYMDELCILKKISSYIINKKISNDGITTKFIIIMIDGSTLTLNIPSDTLNSVNFQQNIDFILNS